MCTFWWQYSSGQGLLHWNKLFQWLWGIPNHPRDWPASKEEEHPQHHQGLGWEDLPQLRVKSGKGEEERWRQRVEKGNGPLGSQFQGERQSDWRPGQKWGECSGIGPSFFIYLHLARNTRILLYFWCDENLDIALKIVGDIPVPDHFLFTEWQVYTLIYLWGAQTVDQENKYNKNGDTHSTVIGLI
jgi:hypothetical protein